MNALEAGMNKKIVDLTLPLRRGMRGVDWESQFTLKRDGCNARTLHLYSHAGTHMDAQAHFGAGPETIDQIAIERCTGRARVVHLMNTRPRALLGVENLGAVAEKFQPGEILLLATGWSRHWADPPLYRDALPRVSEGLARWCVARQVKLLGVEPPSVADVNQRDELTLIHQVLLRAGIVIVEGLTNLDQLPDYGAWFVATPLKIEGGDGCPCRAFAWIGDPG